MAQDKIHQGFLGVFRKGKVEQRYFVLFKDRLDYFNNVEDSLSGVEPRGRLALNDIEELEVLENAFKIELAGNPSRSLELQTEDAGDLQRWINALEPILDEGEEENVSEKNVAEKKAEKKNDQPKNEQPKKEEEDEEVEVVLDGPLMVELQGQMVKKHFWLLADKLEYTNKDSEDEDVQESFPLSTISNVSATSTGFSLMASNRKLIFQCAKKDADVWMTELQNALKNSNDNQATPTPPISIAITKPPEDGAKLSNVQIPPSNAVEVKEKTLCEGALGILRKGRLDSRYFVLYKESFEYWSGKEDYDRGDERRGCVLLADIQRLNNTSSGFIVTLVGDNRSLELRCDTDSELQNWLKQWENVLDAKVCVISKLEAKATDTSASKPTSPEDKAAMKIQAYQRGHAAREQVESLKEKKLEAGTKAQPETLRGFVRWRETEATGAKVQFHNGRNFAKTNNLYCTATVVGKPASMVATSKKMSPNWDEEFEMEEYRGNDSIEFQVLSGSELLGKAILSADQLVEGFEDELQLQAPPEAVPNSGSPGLLKLTAEANHEDRLVIQGELGIQKTKTVERRHFVLFLDRLEYFSSDVDYNNGADPRGMVALQDVTNFTMSREGFVITLGARSVSLHTTAQDAMANWTNAWKEVFEFKAEEPEVNRKAEQPSVAVEKKQTNVKQQPKPEEEKPQAKQEKKDDSPTVSIRFPDAPWPPPQNFKEELQKNLETLGAQQVKKLSVELKPGSVVAVFRGPQASMQELEMAPINLLEVCGYKAEAPRKDGLIFMGSLTIVRNSKSDQRHFALFDNRLDYFASQSDMEAGQDPRGRILLRDIVSLEFKDNAFVLSLKEKGLTLVPDSGKLKLWDLAWAQTEVPRKNNAVADTSSQQKENKSPAPKTPPRENAVNKSSPAPAEKENKSPAPKTSPAPAGKEAIKSIAPVPTPSGIPGKQFSASQPKQQPNQPESVVPASEDYSAMFQQGIPSALIEGELGLQLGLNGRLEPRYFVVFPDRLDVFADALAARSKPPLESAAKTNIEELDCVENGFDINILGNPIKIRKLPGSGEDIQAWNNAFQQMFADDEQAQSAPPAITAPRRNDTSPRQGRRLMWQSMMEVSGGGVSEWRYCALYDDTFTSFLTATDLAEGMEPATRIPISRISDLEVVPQGFAMYLDTRDMITLRVNNEPGLHEAWTTNWQKVFPNLRQLSPQMQMQMPLQQQFAPLQQQQPQAAFGRANLLRQPPSPRPGPGGQPSAPLHEGALELEKGSMVEMRYVVLYPDRMENYKERAHFRRGERPKSIIKFESVQEFSAMSMGFFITYHDVAIRLHARTQPEFDDWRRALNEVFFLDGGDAGANPIMQGTLAIMVDGRPQRQHCLLYPDRFEYTANSDELGQVRIQSICGFRVSDQGFTIRLQNGEMELRAMNQRDLESWLGAFRLAFTGNSGSMGMGPPMSTPVPLSMSPNLARSPPVATSPSRTGARSASPQPRTPQQNSARGNANGNGVIYQGELGIQHGGRLAKKHFVLYPDRLDYFEAAVDAVNGKPTGRIALSEVAGHEIFGTGLILDLLGRKVGLKAAHDSDVKQWDKMLRQAMTSVRPPGFSPIPLNQRGNARTRSTTPTRKAQPRAFDFNNQSMSTNNQSTFMNSMSNLSPIDTQDELTRSRSAPPSRNGDSSARSRSASPRNVRHQDSEGWVQINTFIDPRHEGGRFWRTTDVGETVNKREMCLKEAWHPRMFDVSSKLTGDNRSLTPPRNDIAHKVNVPDEDSRLSIRRLNKERCARHGVPPKITTSTLGGKFTDRTYIKRESPDASYLKPSGKITSTAPNAGAHMRFGADDR